MQAEEEAAAEQVHQLEAACGQVGNFAVSISPRLWVWAACSITLATR
jgi:hypothetical protein